MRYKRIHLRVPAVAWVTLTRTAISVEACAVNISVDGLGTTTPSEALDQVEYQIEITTIEHGKIRCSGIPVHQGKKSVGFKITGIDARNLRIIQDIVADFQTSDNFIKYIEEEGIIDDWLYDDAGRELDITFEICRQKKVPSLKSL